MVKLWGAEKMGETQNKTGKLRLGERRSCHSDENIEITCAAKLNKKPGIKGERQSGEWDYSLTDSNRVEKTCVVGLS